MWTQKGTETVCNIYPEYSWAHQGVERPSGLPAPITPRHALCGIDGWIAEDKSKHNDLKIQLINYFSSDSHPPIHCGNVGIWSPLIWTQLSEPAHLSSRILLIGASSKHAIHLTRKRVMNTLAGGQSGMSIIETLNQMTLCMEIGYCFHHTKLPVRQNITNGLNLFLFLVQIV